MAGGEFFSAKMARRKRVNLKVPPCQVCYRLSRMCYGVSVCLQYVLGTVGVRVPVPGRAGCARSSENAGGAIAEPV